MDVTRTALIEHIKTASSSEDVTSKALTVEVYAGQIKELADLASSLLQKQTNWIRRSQKQMPYQWLRITQSGC